MFKYVFSFFLVFFISLPSFAFTRAEDLVINGEPISLDQIRDSSSKTKKKKGAKNARQKQANKPTVIHAMQADPTNIQFEINTSQVLLQSANDVQLPVSNIAFINVIQEAFQVLEGVSIADIMFAPLKFSSKQPDSEDGINLISFRALTPPEGVSENSAVFTFINYARANTVTFMNKVLMVAPGTILDADITFDPTNNTCLYFFITQGAFKIGGDPLVEIVDGEGGFDPNIAAQNCKEELGAADLVDLAVSALPLALGLSYSQIASAAFSRSPIGMLRYALTNDDTIGLANIYPNKPNLTDRGSIAGKVVINKKPVIGAHVVIEDTFSGEPIASTLSSFDGSFEIMAIPEGAYVIYAEPLDGAVKPSNFTLNIFGANPDLNFSSVVLSEPVSVEAGKTTRVKIEAKENPNVAININPQAVSKRDVLTEGAFIAEGALVANIPIIIMPGQVINDVKFWGDNISDFFGTLSISGSGVTISNVGNKSVPISPFIDCEECEDDNKPGGKKCNRNPLCSANEELVAQADEIPGIEVDITCAPDAIPGPRTIFYTLDKLNPSHPSFGLIDQITGGLIVTEP